MKGPTAGGASMLRLPWIDFASEMRFPFRIAGFFVR
jgi:hypothetical protein